VSIAQCSREDYAIPFGSAPQRGTSTKLARALLFNFLNYRSLRGRFPVNMDESTEITRFSEIAKDFLPL
jgi:hypothetical protein